MRLQSPTFANLFDSKPRLITATLASGAIAGVIEYIFHRKIKPKLRARYSPSLLDSGIMAVITVVLAHIALTAWHNRRMLLLDRLVMVAELNHNVRNALQTLLYSQYLPPKEQTQAVLECVDRIESTLKDLFPTIVEQNAEPPRRLQSKLINAHHRKSAV